MNSSPEHLYILHPSDAPDAENSPTFPIAVPALGALMEASPDGILVTDEKGTIVAANAAAHDLFGHRAPRLVGVCATDLVPRASAWLHDQSGASPVDAPQHPLQGRRLDGSEFPLDCTVSRLETNLGPLCIVTLRDLTAHNEAREALQRSEERFRSAVENMMDGFGLYTAIRDETGCIVDFCIEYVNEAACRLLGIPREQQVGLTFLSLFPSQAQTGLLDACRKLVETSEPLTWESREYEDLDGRRHTRRAFEIHAAKLGDGVLATWRDVTERRRIEEERTWLLEREREIRREAEATNEQLALLAETSALLAQSLDYDTTLRQIASLFVPGFAPACTVDVLTDRGTFHRVASSAVDPAVERALRDLERYPPRPGSSHPVWRVPATGCTEIIGDVPESLIESFAYDANHRLLMRVVNPRAAVLIPLITNGQVVGVISLLWSQPGRPAERVITLSEIIARRCALALENARLHRDLQEALRARETFFASVSHDLKGPLTALKINAELIELIVGRVESAASERETRMAQAASRLGSLVSEAAGFVDELLDVAQLQDGRLLPLNRERVDLGQLVRRTVAARERSLGAHPIRVDLPTRPVIGEWDPGRLARVLGNLLSNAAKYSPPNSEITLTVRRVVHKGARVAALTVQDHGMGIPAADLPHVFERFHRARNVEGHIAGTGLGLWGVKQIVERHDGTVEIQSQESRGTKVVLRLPLTRNTKAPSATG